MARIEAGADVRVSTVERVAAALGLTVRVEADVRGLFKDPPAGSAFAAARDFGVDLGDLYERYRMSPVERLELAAANGRGLGELLS